MDNRAKIIFIHGASSSGKSTLARAVQAQIALPFWHVSIDHLRDSGVLPLERFQKRDFDWKQHRFKFFEGFHNSIVAYASAGNNLLLEHILEEPQWISTLAVLFKPFDVFFVGLHCGLDELNQRETLRGDRRLGSAADDYHRIHKYLRYDLELSSEQTTQDCTNQLLNAWTARQSPSVFETLAIKSLAVE